MSTIHILHLSDIHFKRRKNQRNKAFRQAVQRKLVNAVKSYSEKHNAPDFVVITGDIAFSGKKHEYDEASVFFDKLKAIMPDRTEILAVPGNHDVDRDYVNRFLSMHQIVKEGQTDEFLESKKDVEYFVNVKFQAYRDFCTQFNQYIYESEEDYFWVKNFPEKNVSFLGLNSSWASEGDEDRFYIALGYPQIMAALEKAEDISNRVVLMHHPPSNWLNDLEDGKTRVEMFRHCQLLLHGHSHRDNAIVFKNPSDACICLGSNASYTEGKEGFIGFQFMDVEFLREDTKVRVWPYRLHEQRNEFVPDRERWAGQDGEPYFVIDTLRTTPPPTPPSTLPPIPKGYIDWIQEFHSTLPMDQLLRKGKVVLINLPEIYIPLETSNPFHKSKNEKGSKQEEPATIDIEELACRKNCILLRGKAGMGKTTLVKHLAYSITHGTVSAALKGLLPVLVFLKDLYPIYQNEQLRHPEKLSFESLLEIYLDKSHCPLTMTLLRAYLSHEQAFFLLDGLDEVREDIRDGLVELMHQFQFAHRGNRFLITSRPHGIKEKEMQCFGKYLHDIEYLDDKKVNVFISKWLRAIYVHTKDLVVLTARDMISDIRKHEHAIVFTRNPLLLTALCIFYLVERNRIPDQRADLYDRMINNLLYRRFHAPADSEKVTRVREYLMLLAFTMQKQHIKSIEPCDAIEVLKEKYPPPKDDGNSFVHRRYWKKLFDQIEPVCGLLHRLSSGEIGFVHLSFQEFLAAKHMLDMEINYKIYLEDEWWEETLLLYASLMNLEMKKRSNRVVLDIFENYSKPRIHLLGSRALRDFQPTRREEASIRLAREKLCCIINSDATIEERLEAGEILGELGDPRINILSPPMITVEAGKFEMGADKHEREKPVHPVELDEFMIGKYSVTNKEFKTFIQDGGYENEKFWSQEGWKWRKKGKIIKPRFWHDRKWNGSNLPVLGVSWYEASAYAKWLSQKTKKKYALPTEAQWEKAARGTNELIYPWGSDFNKDYCNSDECELVRTSPVGIFPKGKSSYGCMDMAGNVWEWCFDWYEENYYKKSPAKNPQGALDGSYKVVRGGGWGSEGWRCRTVCREKVPPTYRDIDLGFRIVMLS